MTLARIVSIALLCVGLSGCRYFRSTKVAVPPGAAASTASSSSMDMRQALAQPKEKCIYQGRSAKEWGQALVNEPDRNTAVRASRALRVLGCEGRPYLIQGLESPYSENRRSALEALTVSDLRANGEHGRQLLIKLAGDHGDLRIRERASIYLSQWNRTAPTH